MKERYAVLICPKCKLVQAREVFGSAWTGRKSRPYKTIDCHRCGKTLSLRKVQVLFQSDNVTKATEWLRNFKMEHREQTFLNG